MRPADFRQWAKRNTTTWIVFACSRMFLALGLRSFGAFGIPLHHGLTILLVLPLSFAASLFFTPPCSQP